MARKVKSVFDTNVVRHMVTSLSVSLVEETKPPISNGYPKSDYSDMDVFRDCKRF